MSVAKICSRHPVTAPASAPLSEVARLMYERRVGAVIITQSPAEAPVPVGIITDRDIVRAQLNQAADFSRLSAASVMTRDPLVLVDTLSFEDALRRLRERGVRRAPVVDASGALIGIVSTDDLIVCVANELASIGRLLEQQAAHFTQ